LEEFFAVLARAADLHDGQIFHAAGDGMMVAFGVNDSATDGAAEALAASRTMLQQFAPIAMRWRHELSIKTGIGVGLHVGEVAVVLLGPPGRQAVTLVGDTVNVASRLCSRARVGEVLFSSCVADSLGIAVPREPIIGPTDGSAPFLQLPQFELRGRTAPLDIWCVPVSERHESREVALTP
jgi:adenylate cyclase